MKKYIAVFALCALTVLGLGSCVKPVEENLQGETLAGHTVAFDASLASQSRTGLAFKFVPNWIQTKTDNVHLFETLVSTGRAEEGENVQMEIVEGTHNEVARFTAEFGSVTDIFVNTRSVTEDVYTAVIAQRIKGLGDAPDLFVVPAEQTPNAESLIDPDADFLIGKCVQVTTDGESKQVDLEFIRPVAASRLAIMNIEGQKIKSVKITSNDKLTGSVTYDNIDFEQGTAAFDAESGSTELTISYGETGVDVDASATFYAYFMSLPGTKRITSVVVTTDQYIYTKSFSQPKSLTFDSEGFKNIAVDMSSASRIQLQELAFSTEALSVMMGRSFTIPTLSGNKTTPAYSSDNTDVATVNDSNGTVTLVAPGMAVITAAAPAGNGYAAGSASYTLTVVSAPELPAHFYKKVTTLSGVTTDKRYLIVYDNAASSRIFKPVLNDSLDGFLQTGNTLNATVVNDSLIMADPSIDLYQIAFANIGTGSDAGKMAVSALNAYGETPYFFMLYGPDSAFAGDPEENGYRASFSINSNGVLAVSRGNDHHLSYSNSAFRHASSAPSNSRLALYESVAGLVPQTLVFSAPSASGVIGMPVTAPTLSGYATTVTYTSGDETIATVNATSGALTLKAAGETTITATAAEENGYAGAQASYTLTVSAPEPLADHYYQKVTQVSDIVADGQYLIVYENGSASKVFKPVLNGAVLVESSVDNTLEASLYGGLYILSTDALDACRFRLMNQDGTALKFSIFMPALALYFHPYNETNNFAADEDTGYRSTFTLDGGLVSIVAKGKAVRYSTANHWFLASSSDNDGVLPALYRYVEGVNPDPVAQTLTINPASLSGSVGQSKSVTVSGAYTTVTWTTSDAAVAEYNTMTGKVDLKAEGTATITASAAAENGYAAASKDLEVTVSAASSTSYYVKVSSTSALPTEKSKTVGYGDYIFVYEISNTQAVVLKPICPSAPTGDGDHNVNHVELTKTGSAIAVSLTSSGIEATDAVAECKVQFGKHDSKEAWNMYAVDAGWWIRLNNDSTNGVRILAMTSGGYSSTFTFSGTSGNNLTLSRTDSNRTAYLQYNSTDNCFEATSSNSARVSLYQLSE